MKKASLILLSFLILVALASCSPRPESNARMQQEMSQVSTAPPPVINYTKTIDVAPVKGNPSWESIPTGTISTTILTDKTRTGGIGIPITVQAAQNGREIFFRVRWPDSNSHISADWYAAEKLAFNWGIRSQGFSSEGCGAACHFWPANQAHGRISGMWLPEENGVADSWVWMADAPGKGKIQHRLLTGKPVVVKVAAMPMMGMATHSMRLGFKTDPVLSSLSTEESYGSGEWTLLITRQLATSNKNEIQFIPEKNPYYTFGMSVFPGTHMHDYSGMLTLRFLKH